MNVAYNSINCVIKKISNIIEILNIFNVIIIKICLYLLCFECQLPRKLC